MLLAALGLLAKQGVLLGLLSGLLLGGGLLRGLLLCGLLLLLGRLVHQTAKQSARSAAEAAKTSETTTRSGLPDRLLGYSASHTGGYLTAAAVGRCCSLGRSRCGNWLVGSRNHGIHLGDFIEDLLAGQIVVGHLHALNGLGIRTAQCAQRGQGKSGELFHEKVFQQMGSWVWMRFSAGFRSSCSLG